MSATSVGKPINLTIDSDLLADAKALNINLSRAAEEGVRAAVIQVREQQWKAENLTALESSNSFVESHSLHLSGSASSDVKIRCLYGR
nr:type II toxin-antitoxin system CcdA family antitoxin [uncultured Roseovarius sp.]